MTPKFHGKVDQTCKLILVNKEGFKKHLFLLKGKQVVLTVKSVKEDRPDPLRKYYWGIVAEMISDHTGHSREVIHIVMKGKYSFDESVFSHGSTMTQEEKERFIKNVRYWASDFLDVKIPERGNVEC